METAIAIELTAKEFGISIDDVKHALKISAAHHKHSQKLREQRRLANEEALNRRQLEEAKAASPNRCFCHEEGLEVEHDWKNDLVIRHEKMRSFYPLSFTPNGQYYDDPVYQCSRCGKEWRIQVAMA